MTYVKNNGRYALAFIVTRANGYEFKIELDRKRIYLDTGNVATTGITAVSDEDYKLLEKIPQFKERLESKEFEIVDKPELSNTSSAEAEVLKKENEELKKKLAEQKTDKEDKETKKELKEKDKEIASLKEKLEKLTASKEVEGF